MVLPEVSWKGPGGPLEAWKCSPRRDPENPGPGRPKAPRTVRVRAFWVLSTGVPRPPVAINNPPMLLKFHAGLREDLGRF